MDSRSSQRLYCHIERRWLMHSCVVIICAVLTKSSPVLFHYEENICPSKCICGNTTVTCESYIPFVVPDTTTDIVLSQIDWREFYENRFCHVSWKNVTKLTFESVKSDLQFFRLEDGVFNCLGHITIFKFSSGYLDGFSIETFAGLKGVTVFDLSGCQAIPWDDLYKTMSLSTNLPVLTHLLLSGAGIYDGGYLDFNQSFAKSLSIRPITFIDLSFSSFYFSFSTPGKLCETLIGLNLAGAQIGMTEDFCKNCSCIPLQYLDESESKSVRNSLKNASCINSRLRMVFTTPFFYSIRVLYFNRIVTPSLMFRLSNCTLHLFDHSSLKELHFSQNYLPNFEFRLINDELEILDLSENDMQSIDPDTFKNLTSLKRLDLSKNRLVKVQSSKNFSELLKYNKNLEILSLASNGLKFLPAVIFEQNTHLQKLDLSYNFLEQITFNISFLLHLTVFDLRFNNIRSLNRASRDFLENLYDNQRPFNSTNNSSVVEVLLEGNPFTCECASFNFLQWFAVSPIFAATRNKHHCQLHGKEFPMTSAAVKAASEDCAEARRKRLILIFITTLSSVCVIAITLTLVILYKRHKKRQLYQRLKNGIRHLRENAQRFPVFLSYCSDDRDFVTVHILKQLQAHLQAITELDRDLVCHADSHFMPARTILSEIFRCLKDSEIFVAVVSRNYCRSRFCQFEIEHAKFLKRPIILVFIEHVEEDSMSSVMREVFETFTRVQFVFEDGQYRIQPEWSHICESLIQML